MLFGKKTRTQKTEKIQTEAPAEDTAPEPQAPTSPAPKKTPAPSAVAGLAADPVALLAAAVSLTSAVLTVWGVTSVLDGLAPLPVALVVGAGVEAAWLYALALEWQRSAHGPLRRWTTAAGWVLALLAVAVLVAHAAEAGWALLAVAWLPLGAKTGWMIRVSARAEAAAARAREEAERAAAEEQRARKEERLRREREEMLSTDLTDEQKAEIARRRRERAFAEALTAEDQADAEAQHNKDLADIKRASARQMAIDAEQAEIEKQRLQLARSIQLAAPVTSLGLPAASAVPDDASQLDAAPAAAAGFGGAMAAHLRTGASPASRADLGVPPQSFPGAPRGASGGTAVLPEPQQLLLAYIDRHGQDSTVKGAARELGVDPRSVRRHRDALAQEGYDVSVLFPRERDED